MKVLVLSRKGDALTKRWLTSVLFGLSIYMITVSQAVISFVSHITIIVLISRFITRVVVD